MARHSRDPVPRARRSHRGRLVVVALAPLLVLVPLSAWAVGSATIASPGHHVKKTSATSAHVKKAAGTGQHVKKAAGTAAAGRTWSRSFAPPLALLVHGKTAGFVSLPLSMSALGSQKATATATFRTNWVDVKALKDGPNVAQQGLSIHPPQFKLQIAHGPRPSDHRGNCHIEGATGHVLAVGPNIDVADGKWHTITCVKYPDTAKGTEVVVIVDGVAGKPKWSRTPIGDIRPVGGVRLGGRSSVASTDSLDGWIQRLSFRLT
ncbi:MAG: hypothetical protein ACHQE5_01550 [Actinomycetes bacterium]